MDNKKRIIVALPVLLAGFYLFGRVVQVALENGRYDVVTHIVKGLFVLVLIIVFIFVIGVARHIKSHRDARKVN